ncbi:MAG TPA: hypothetical protein VGM98_14870 [Schlesneria sp.]|jgi:hypothetical protein
MASLGLQEALQDISAIRHQMARAEQFRGYRAVPVCMSGLFAVVGGLLQAAWISDPQVEIKQYLFVWLSVAAASQVVCLASIWRRYRMSKGLLHQETTHLALGQFYPCLVAGALLTFVIVKSVPQAVGMLPGLWAVLFSLGLFASLRLLPRPMVGVACYYLVGGLYVVSLENSPSALGPWTMPLLFGVGQLLTAAILSQSEKNPIDHAT